MFWFLVMAGVAALLLHEVLTLPWPAAIALGVLGILAIGVWGMITRPWRIRHDLEDEYQQLLRSGFKKEAAREMAWSYVRNKYNLR
jgi:hypothetical protein